METDDDLPTQLVREGPHICVRTPGAGNGCACNNQLEMSAAPKSWMKRGMEQEHVLDQDGQGSGTLLFYARILRLYLVRKSWGIRHQQRVGGGF